MPVEPRDTLHECDRLTFAQFPKADELGLKLSFKIIQLITSKSFENYVEISNKTYFLAQSFISTIIVVIKVSGTKRNRIKNIQYP